MRERLKLFKLMENQFRDARGGGEMPPGFGCCCACAFAGQGGSSTADNWQANDNGGKHSPQCHDFIQ